MGNNRNLTLETFLAKSARILSAAKKKKIIESYGLVGELAVGAIGVPRAGKKGKERKGI